MTRYDDDRTARLLSRALTEEADRVDPSPGGLQAIQRRTASASPMRRRPWVLGAFGAGLATAAVITAVVLVGRAGGPAQTPAAGRHSGGTVQQSGPHRGVYDPNAPASSQHTLYYVGPQPDIPRLAPRLYAETHTISTPGLASNVAAVQEFLTSTPLDPDYSSGWPEGVDVSGITDDASVTTIALTGDADLGTRPAGGANLGESAGADIAIQALLATAQVDTPAAFTYNGEPIDRLLNQDVSPSVTPKSDDEVRAFISIDNVVDGQTVTNPVTVLVSGNVFEGNVNWQLLDPSGTTVTDGYVTTSMGTWTQAAVHLGALDPGTYTFKAFEASADDGRPINVDDKTFTVE